VSRNGRLVYDGPSSFTDERIFCVATGFVNPSQNDKTGPMLQGWIVPWEHSPLDAVPAGLDRCVCGDCRNRPADGGCCYVMLRRGPQQVWYSHRRMNPYPALEPSEHRSWPSPLAIRFGAWGDPVAAPASCWAPLRERARTWTGYTAAWRTAPLDAWWWLMASVTSPAERDEAKALGWRTFRIRLPGEPVLPGEIVCPASPEGGHRTTCIRCGLCSGARVEASLAARSAPDPVIIAHGCRAHRLYLQRHQITLFRHRPPSRIGRERWKPKPRPPAAPQRSDREQLCLLPQPTLFPQDET